MTLLRDTYPLQIKQTGSVKSFPKKLNPWGWRQGWSTHSSAQGHQHKLHNLHIHTSSPLKKRDCSPSCDRRCLGHQDYLMGADGSAIREIITLWEHKALWNAQKGKSSSTLLNINCENCLVQLQTRAMGHYCCFFLQPPDLESSERIFITLLFHYLNIYINWVKYYKTMQQFNINWACSHSQQTLSSLQKLWLLTLQTLPGWRPVTSLFSTFSTLSL